MKIKFLISILLLMTLLVGCGAKEMQFSDIVQDDVEKITLRHGGNGVLYSTTNNELINEFIGTLEKANYYESEDFGIAGGSSIRLYNELNKEVAILNVTSNGVKINRKSFRTNINLDKELNEFYKKLLTEQNEVKE